MKENTLSIKQGRVYWVNAEPHAGREMGGHAPKIGNTRRPVVVISNDTYNQDGLAIYFSCTSHWNPRQYLMPIFLNKPSFIMLNRLVSYDMLARGAHYEGMTIPRKELMYLRSVAIGHF